MNDIPASADMTEKEKGGRIRIALVNLAAAVRRGGGINHQVAHALDEADRALASARAEGGSEPPSVEYVRRWLKNPEFKRAVYAASAPPPSADDAKALARAIYSAWQRDERWTAKHIPAPQAYFWAELAAQAALRTPQAAETGGGQDDVKMDWPNNVIKRGNETYRVASSPDDADARGRELADSLRLYTESSAVPRFPSSVICAAANWIEARLRAPAIPTSAGDTPDDLFPRQATWGTGTVTPDISTATDLAEWFAPGSTVKVFRHGDSQRHIAFGWHTLTDAERELIYAGIGRSGEGR